MLDVSYFLPWMLLPRQRLIFLQFVWNHTQKPDIGTDLHLPCRFSSPWPQSWQRPWCRPGPGPRSWWCRWGRGRCRGWGRCWTWPGWGPRPGGTRTAGGRAAGLRAPDLWPGQPGRPLAYGCVWCPTDLGRASCQGTWPRNPTEILFINLSEDGTFVISRFKLRLFWHTLYLW